MPLPKLITSLSILLFFSFFHLLKAQSSLDDKVLNELKIQIFLNEKNHGPGYIDGRIGNFTNLAIRAYNLKLERTETDSEYKKEALAKVTDPLLIAIVPSIASQYLNSNLSHKKEQQTYEKYMGYRSYAEFIAERYHTSEEFLIKLNGYNRIKKLKPRSALIVPNVTPFLIEKLSANKTYTTSKSHNNRAVIIDTTQNQLYIYETHPQSFSDYLEAKNTQNSQNNTENDSPTYNEILFQSLTNTQLIASFPITSGKSKYIRYGYWEIKTSVELPVWRYDKQLLETGVYSKKSLNIPEGPNNPIGVMWNGLTRKGIGIHGTSNPETIGRSKSAGCIRLSNWNVTKIPSLVRPGCPVWLK